MLILPDYRNYLNYFPAPPPLTRNVGCKLGWLSPPMVMHYQSQLTAMWRLVLDWVHWSGNGHLPLPSFPLPPGRPARGTCQSVNIFWNPTTAAAMKLTAWARACFEQGALPSLLYLPGIVPVFSLPGRSNVSSQS